MSVPRYIKWIALAAGAALVCAAVVLGWKHLSTDPPLRIGINAWPGYEHIYLAKVGGHFQREGVEVEVVEFNSLLDARRAFERGQIDGLGTTATDLALTLGQTTCQPRIVQVVDYSNGGDLVVADSSIHRIEDLRGKRVGLESGSVSSYVLARALAKGNLGGKDLAIVSADQTSLLEDFLSGKLSAIVTYSPFSLKALASGKNRVLFSSREIPEEVVDVLAFHDSTLANRPQDVRKVLRAYWSAREAADRSPAENIPLMARREGISDSDFLGALRDEIRLLSPADQAPYFGRNGRLVGILARADSVLRTEGLITGPIRRMNEIQDPLLVDPQKPPP